MHFDNSFQRVGFDEAIFILNSNLCDKCFSIRNNMQCEYWLLSKQKWPLIFILKAIFLIMPYEFYFGFCDEEMCRIHDHIKTNVATDNYF